MSISTILVWLALVCFVLATCGVTARINLVALGLAFVVASKLV